MIKTYKHVVVTRGKPSDDKFYSIMNKYINTDANILFFILDKSKSFAKKQLDLLYKQELSKDDKIDSIALKNKYDNVKILEYTPKTHQRLSFDAIDFKLTAYKSYGYNIDLIYIDNPIHLDPVDMKKINYDFGKIKSKLNFIGNKHECLFVINMDIDLLDFFKEYSIVS